MGLFESLANWFDGPSLWLILGLVLLGLEVFAPGTFFLWFGVSAMIVGGLSFLVVVDWKIQVLVWAGLALALVFLGRRYFRSQDRSVEDPFLNERASRYTGRQFTLAEPIVENQGTLKVDDTIWRISGPDMPAGTRIQVIGVDGPILRVAVA